jgi:hypothetical protein
MNSFHFSVLIVSKYVFKKVIFVNQSYLWQAVALASASEVAFLHFLVTIGKSLSQ